MSLQDHPRAYGTAVVVAAFAAGVVATLGFKDLYPDLERRFEQSRKWAKQRRKTQQQQRGTGEPASRAESSSRRHSSLLPFWGSFSAPVQLEDHESDGGATAAAGRLSLQVPPPPLPLLGATLNNPTTTNILDGVVDGIEGCIGNTPLVRLRSLSEATGCEILAKAELLNPGGSPKDRVALSLIRGAEARGQLRPHRGDTIYEGTSGSTGISLATLARALGYRAHICMPDDQSLEKSRLLREMGAAVERVPVAPIVDPGHFVNLARRRAAEHEALHADGSRGFFADQFESPDNYEAHRVGTGAEIARQTADRPPDAFVCGAGTGGTITGVAKALKEDAGLAASKKLRVVVADPRGSGLYNRVKYGVLYSHTEKEGTRRRTQVDTIVEGIGMNRVTATLEAGIDLIDDAVAVSDDQACRMARWLVERDGVFAGSSTAVNCVAAVATALTLPRGSRVVTILCDSGLRHLSKFYKRVEEMGLEGGEEGGDGVDRDDLVALLGLQPRKAELEDGHA